MCGRFTQAYTWQEQVPGINLQPRYNIAPTTTIDTIIPRGADRQSTVFNQGLTKRTSRLGIYDQL